MTVMQLDIYGREIPYEQTTGRQRARGEQQQAVMRHLIQAGQIKSTEAGIIVHQKRGHCGCRTQVGSRAGMVSKRGIACCRWAAIDGNRALHRLALKGLVRRDWKTKTWHPVTQQEPTL